MTLSEKCSLWIKAAKEEHISDETFDVLSSQLYRNYEKLPKWFTKQVSEDCLACGTTLGLDIKFLLDKFEV